MLAEMVSVIGGVEDVCVVQLTRRIESYDKVAQQLINGLERLKPGSLPKVIVGDDRVIERRKIANPVRTSLYGSVEVGRARDLVVEEHVLMARSAQRCRDIGLVVLLIVDPVGVRCNGRDGQEPGLVVRKSLGEEVVGLLRNDVR